MRAVRQMDGREITQHILFLTSCVVFVRGFVLYLCRWMENNSTYFVRQLAPWNVAAFKALELNQGLSSAMINLAFLIVNDFEVLRYLPNQLQYWQNISFDDHLVSLICKRKVKFNKQLIHNDVKHDGSAATKFDCYVAGNSLFQNRSTGTGVNINLVGFECLECCNKV